MGEPASPRVTHQVAPALLIGLAAAFTLAGYEFVRTPTNTLYVATYGKAGLPMVMALIPLAVLGCTYAYGWLLSRLGPRRTLFWTTLGSCGLIAALQLAFDAGVKEAIAPLYLFRNAYVVLIIEQYWSYINSTLSQANAKRLNGPISGIASIGSIAAGLVGASAVASLGTNRMVLFAVVATLPAAFISDFVYRKYGGPRDEPRQHAEGHHLALHLFRTEKRLPLLLGMVILTQVIEAVMALAFQGELSAAYPEVDRQTAYSYAYFAWINGIAAGLQFLVAPILLNFVRPGLMNLIIPIVHIVACAAYLKDPGLTTAAIAYAGFKSIDYSLFRAAKEVLYVPLSFEARYRTKEVIDVFGYRFSKGITSGCITIVQNLGVAVTEVGYGAVAMVAAVLWAGLTLPLSKHYGGSDAEENKSPEAAP